ncbi:transcriptional repressor LexA [Patescibacteria group bacterium]|nr:transcriptional repressor LexA [Patescibacteria group bacterium]
MSNSLNNKEIQALRCIRNSLIHRDKSPSLRELMKELGYKSSLSPMLIVNKLIKLGFLKRDGRNLTIIKELGNNQEHAKTIDIPLVGTAPCGAPILAEENIETTIPVSTELAKSGYKYFLLRTIGDSMNKENIEDGDLALVKQQQAADNGDVIIALIDNEATIKKFYRANDAIILKPSSTNPIHKPIILNEDFIIQGKVVSIIKNFEDIDKKQDEEKEFLDITTKYINETNLKYRKSLGQYFTPKTVREALLNKLPNTIKNPKVLDPACGTGEFLITAKKYFKNPDLRGWDIDKKLSNITKEAVPEARLKNIDALLNEDYEKYDFVIGNPPYYEFTPTVVIKERFKDIINGRINIFSLFIYQGIKWLKNGGYLAYVVPPSMNNGAYFLKLRKFITENTNIEYLHILDNSKIFHGALQSTMLIILKKGTNKGNYLFKKNGILIFSENAQYLKKSFKNKLTLHDLNYQVRTGRLVWNQNKELLTNNPKESIPLIWAHNITSNGLKLPIINERKPQYVKIKKYDIGPAIVVNRITGSVNSAKLKAAIIPAEMKFIAENHINVIFPPSRQERINLKNREEIKFTLEDIKKQLISDKKLKVVRNITGNTQISKTELEKLFPIDIDRDSIDSD